jgi:hypothetical protein
MPYSLYSQSRRPGDSHGAILVQPSRLSTNGRDTTPPSASLHPPFIPPLIDSLKALRKTHWKAPQKVPPKAQSRTYSRAYLKAHLKARSEAQSKPQPKPQPIPYSIPAPRAVSGLYPIRENCVSGRASPLHVDCGYPRSVRRRPVCYMLCHRDWPENRFADSLGRKPRGKPGSKLRSNERANLRADSTG